MAMLVLFSISALAQWGTSRINIRYPVYRLPSQYVPESQRTYNIQLGLSRAIQPFVSYDEIAAPLEMTQWGWNRVDNPNDASLVVNITARDFIIEAIHDEEHTEMVRIHGEMVPRKFYTPHIDYTIVLGWNLDLNGQTVVSYTNINPETRRPPMATFHMDRRFYSRRECHEFVRNNNDVFLEQIIMTELLVFTEPIQDAYRNQFYYTCSSDNVRIALFDSKKNQYYAKHQQAAGEIRKAIESIPINGGTAEAVKDLQPWIEHFKELEKELSSADKKQKAAKADMVFNLANIYYALEIFDVAREYAERLATEFDDGYGKRMIRWIDSMESDLKKHHLLTRRF